MSRLDDELREILMDLRYTQDRNILKAPLDKLPNPTNVAIEQIKMAIKSNVSELVDELVTGLGGDVPYGELTERIDTL
jgi:hypothetical protein